MHFWSRVTDGRIEAEARAELSVGMESEWGYWGRGGTAPQSHG